MSLIVEFFIPGEPVAKGRGRAAVINGHAHVFTPAKTRDYENLVKSESRRAMAGKPPLDVAVCVTIKVTLPIPSSFSLKQQVRSERGELLPTKRPDLDNVAKAVSDGMNSIVFVDDKLICEMHLCKSYGLIPGIEVLVSELEKASVMAKVPGGLQRSLLEAAKPF